MYLSSVGYCFSGSGMIISIGSLSVFPNHASKGVTPVVLFTFVLYARAAVDMNLSQSLSSQLMYTLRIWFKILWKLSTLFESGLKAGVSVLLICSLSFSCVQTLLTHSFPWSVCIVVGHPNLVIQLSSTAFDISSASLHGPVLATLKIHLALLICNMPH